MDFAKEQAKAKDARAIILETQSCNTKAIAFYRKQGFFLAGFNSCEYSNADIEKKEIRMEFAYILQ